MAAGFGPVLREHAAAHDRDGTWVAESYEALRQGGLLTLGVPTELGGMGASIAEIAAVDRELARHCGSTALAMSMHHHVTAFTAWRWRRDLPGAEATLQARRRRRDRAGVDGRRRLHPPQGHGRQGRRRLAGQRAQAVRQPVARRRRDVDDVHVRRSRARPPRAQHGRAVRRGRHGSSRTGTRSACAARRATTSTIDGRVRARRQDPRRPPLRRRRSAAAGDLQHRLPDHQRRLPRRRRGRRRGGDRGRPRPRPRPDRAAPGRPDAPPPARRRLGARRRPRGRRRRPGAVDGDGRRGDGRQARDRHRRRRGLRPGDGARRRLGVPQGLASSSGPTATSAAPSCTRSTRRRRSSTPAASPSASPATSSNAPQSATDPLRAVAQRLAASSRTDAARCAEPCARSESGRSILHVRAADVDAVPPDAPGRSRRRRGPQPPADGARRVHPPRRAGRVHVAAARLARRTRTSSAIVREEMDAAGFQEVHFPALLPRSRTRRRAAGPTTATTSSASRTGAATTSSWRRPTRRCSRCS